MATSTATTALPAGAVAEGAVLVQQAARLLAPSGARVLVQAGAPDARLRLAPCTAATAFLVAGAPAWGATRFGLRCTQGALWRIQVPVQVQVWAPAVVTTLALPAAAVLANHHLKLADVNWAAHPAPANTTASASSSTLGGQPAQAALFSALGEVQARRLTRPLAPGEPVRALDLQTKLWFAAGETVAVVAVGDGFAVASEGQALSPGVEGQLVRVRTENGRVITGQAVGQRRVELRL